MRTLPPAIAAVLVLLVPAGAPAQQQTLAGFFRDFTAEWVRSNPNQAAAKRFFTGEEQDRFERELSPETPEFRAARVRLARRGLDQLRAFDRARMSEVERVSAAIMDWQLDTVVKGEPYADYAFPLDQFAGANVNLVAVLTVTHPMATGRDAANYVARLGEVGRRLGEATADARRLSAKGLMPPRFILQATIRQMKAFIAPGPADNPFAAIFAERIRPLRA